MAKASPQFTAHGKVLLSAEYFVLKGARSLVLPLQLGQSLTVKTSSGSELVWKSLDHRGEVWFEGKYDIMGMDIIKSSDDEIAERLRKVLKACCRDNSDFLSKWYKYRVETRLDFDPAWGLGSSAGLISMVSDWAEANPYLVLFDSLGGSGADLAAARSDGPIHYTLEDDSLSIDPVDFMPSFQDQLLFVYGQQKVSSSDAVKYFQKQKVSSSQIDEVSALTDAMTSAKSIQDFIKLVDEHERIISESIKTSRLQDELFPDFEGSIKSLGAWGGDFFLACSPNGADWMNSYFEKKGFSIRFTFDRFVL